jgi:hypothetical protein
LVFRPRDERSLANGQPDTDFNRLILEYKKPGAIKSENVKNRQFITQVKGYISKVSRKRSTLSAETGEGSSSIHRY